MAFYIKINHIRRKIMRGLSRILIKSYPKLESSDASLTVRSILICRPNHRLGNLLLLTPLLQEIETVFPGASIDIFVRGNLAPVIFREYRQVANIIALPSRPFDNLFEYLKRWGTLRHRRYDLVINAEPDSSSGRIATRMARGSIKSYGESPEEVEYVTKQLAHLAKRPVHALRLFLENYGYAFEKIATPLIDIRLSAAELNKGSDILHDITSNKARTISIFTFATGPKKYPESWWSEFYGRLKTEFADFNIIEILPKENVSQINFEAASYYSTDLREIAAVIANTDIFIGADSGMMHLATASQVPVAALFSVTDANRYGPYGNGSVSLDTNLQDIDFCIGAIRRMLEIRSGEFVHGYRKGG